MPELSGEEDDMEGSRLKRAWHALLANVTVPIALYMMLAGVDGALSDGEQVEDLLPHLLTHVWTASLFLGGLGVVVGTATERTRVESFSHALLLWGLLVLAIVVDSFIAIIALALMSLLRMRVLHKSRKAQQEAARLNGGD